MPSVAGGRRQPARPLQSGEIVDDPVRGHRAGRPIACRYGLIEISDIALSRQDRGLALADPILSGESLLVWRVTPAAETRGQ